MWIDQLNVDGAQVGVLNFDTVVSLANALGTPDPVPIVVFAWMTDVSLSYPMAGTSVTYVSQSKVVRKKRVARNSTPAALKEDEFTEEPNQGVLSKPLALVSKAAGILVDVPWIGRFMRATEIGAGKLAQVASVFGFSRPRVLTAPQFMTQLNFPFMPYQDTASNSVALTVNAKQELSIDPRIIGLDSDEDELTILSIAMKPTMGPTFTWSSTHGVGTTLGSWDVHPLCMDTNSGTLWGPTAVSAASAPFRYWHGSLVFTFTVVASRFHRGRLRFEWVPDTAASGATTTNITYSHVVDIAKSRHFRVTIPYTRREGAYDFGIIGTPLSGNGRLRVRVVNELVSPGAATDITIIPWLAAGADYEVSILMTQSLVASG
jgi:hypothetical protein